MGRIAARLKKLGHDLPGPLILPPGVILPFAMVNIRGQRALISGHGPQAADGSMAGPFGAVGRELSEAEGYVAAQKTGLSILGSLERALGDLDRITGWVKVLGMVKCAEGFDRMPAVINGFSDLILEVFGPEVGAHARSAVGMEVLPFDIPVEIEAEVLIGP